jgi:hypothetical protein
LNSPDKRLAQHQYGDRKQKEIPTGNRHGA